MPAASGVRAVDLGPGVDAYFTGADLSGVDDANLAHHRPHVPERLARARDVVGAASGTDPATWHLMRQVHGADVAVVDETVPVGTEVRGVDAMVTTLVARPLVVLAADCIPLLAAGVRAVGAAHVGWRGLAADMPGALVSGLLGLGEHIEDVRVALGPAIGPCCYEVGPEVVDVVAAIDPGAVGVTRAGTPSVDLRAATRGRLRELGVATLLLLPDGTVDDGVASTAAGPCTACGSGWFSHRRHPGSGRQAGIVVRREEVRR